MIAPARGKGLVARLLSLLLVVAAAAASTGCLVVSVAPLYTDESLADDPDLVGRWEDAEDRISLTIARGGWHAYEVTWNDSSGAQEVTAHVVRLGPQTFVDIRPRSGRDHGPLLLPVHGIARLSREGDVLRLEPLENETLRQAAMSGQLRGLSHAFDDRQFVLITAPTRALREWLAARSAADGLFGAPLEFTRASVP